MYIYCTVSNIKILFKQFKTNKTPQYMPMLIQMLPSDRHKQVAEFILLIS